MSRGEFLLEVRTEEIPARMLAAAAQELGSRLFEELMARGGLAPSEVETAYTPRRLVLVLGGLPEREASRDEEVLGPPARAAFAADGSPTPAAQGFARRLGLDASALKRIATEKGEYVAAVRRIEGRATAAILGEVVPRVLAGIGWAKTMRWGTGVGPWVRPVHGLLALLDGEVVPCELFGVRAGRGTVGHPVLSPRPFEVADLADYRARLAERGILTSPTERRKAIETAMRERATALGGELVVDSPLLDKLAAICEIPGVLEGGLAPEFLELPREVLATSLRDHQSALTVERDGRLLPVFLTVMDRPDDPAGRVRAGNEWVVAARLADAKFFYGKDRVTSLAERAPQLANLTFHDKLGSYAAKTSRLAALTATLAEQVGLSPAEREAAIAAARLLKVDLATDMVREFTSLQGVMGGIYAREEGAPEAVWQAIYDQYQPAAADDGAARGRVGRVVGLADRLDTLVGMFGLGLVPTGSKDPLGLRRAALGFVKTLLDGHHALALGPAIARAHAGYEKLPKAADAVAAALVPFLAERARFLLGLAGFAYDEIEASLALGIDDLPTLARRVAALHAVRGERDFLGVVLSAKRIANITRSLPAYELAETKLAAGAESDLLAAGTALAADLDRRLPAGDFEGALRAVAALAGPLERFFVEVLVMDPDEAVKRQRIALLQKIHREIGRLADLSAVVVDKADYR
ncbi:MAG: glycine--tRNA ligase subunit beta [Thermoanaerobaculia bacterium]